MSRQGTIKVFTNKLHTYFLTYEHVCLAMLLPLPVLLLSGDQLATCCSQQLREGDWRKLFTTTQLLQHQSLRAEIMALGINIGQLAASQLTIT